MYSDFREGKEGRECREGREGRKGIGQAEKEVGKRMEGKIGKVDNLSFKIVPGGLQEVFREERKKIVNLTFRRRKAHIIGKPIFS